MCLCERHHDEVECSAAGGRTNNNRQQALEHSDRAWPAEMPDIEYSKGGTFPIVKVAHSAIHVTYAMR